MILQPPRRTYGLSPSLVTVIVLLTIGFVGLNIFVVMRTDLGSSFYANWLAGRVLFAQGQNPYSAEVFENIILRNLDDVRLSGFVLPLYAVLPTLLLSFINHFETALVIWMTICEAALILTAIRAIDVMRIRSGLGSPYIVGALISLGYYGFYAVVDGDLGILSVLCLMVGINAVRENEPEFAGIMLALATMKYSITLLPILWALIWALANRRGAVAVWFAMVLALLTLISFLFMPNWLTEFFRSIIYYYKYLMPMYFALFIEVWQPEIGGRIAWAVSGFVALLIVIEWILNARGDERAFEWVLSMTLCAGFFVGFPNIGKNLYLLWIPLFSGVDKALQRWPKRVGRMIAVGLISAFLIVPWVVTLFVTGFAEPVSALNFIFPAVTLFLLYWNRWWTILRLIET